MTAFNDFFGGIAEAMGLPVFFQGSTLFLNNFFLALFGVVLVIALVLVLVLVPGKRKKAAARQHRKRNGRKDLIQAPFSAKRGEGEIPRRGTRRNRS